MASPSVPEIRRAILEQVQIALQDINESNSYRMPRDFRIKDYIKVIRAFAEALPEKQRKQHEERPTYAGH